MSSSPLPSTSSSSSCCCPVCSHRSPTVRKLKTHLLLSHPDVNLCLFCVEKKGWSDTFASQGQYNQHFADHHEGAIVHDKPPAPRGARKRNKKAKEAAEEEREDSGKKMRPGCKTFCFRCDHRPEFSSGMELERHLLSAHFFDYCKLCGLIGPSPTVRYHIGDLHEDVLCHVCLGSSPVFTSRQSLLAHLANCHGIGESRFPCPDCPTTPENSSSRPRLRTRPEYQSHLLDCHLTKGDRLKPMRKRRGRKPKDAAAGKERFAAMAETREDGDVEVSLERELEASAENDVCRNVRRQQHASSSSSSVAPLSNPGGQDCFAVASVHLLAQTDLADRLAAAAGRRDCGSCDGDAKCPDPTCILAELLSKYRGARRGNSSSDTLTSSLFRLTSNYKSFGVTAPPVDCGDFLRSALAAVCSDASGKKSTGLDDDMASAFDADLHWKFECPQCKRFSVTSLRDRVLRLDGSSPSTLQSMLDAFLHSRACGGCGHMCQVLPGVKRVGKFVLLEVDRQEDGRRGRTQQFRSSSREVDEDAGDSKEILLYPLQLKESYSLFGFRYSLLATLHYHLEAEEGGGHYLAHVHDGGGGDFALRVHEDQVSRVRKAARPDFDSDVVVVALRRVEMTETDRSRIALEPEYGDDDDGIAGARTEEGGTDGQRGEEDLATLTVEEERERGSRISLTGNSNLSLKREVSKKSYSGSRRKATPPPPSPPQLRESSANEEDEQSAPIK